MSAPETAPEVREQFVTKQLDETLLELESLRLALGFLTANALAAVIIHQFAKVPERKVWEALAKVSAYHPAPEKTKKSGGKRR